MSTNLRNGSKVRTPNGLGELRGRMLDDYGHLCYLVAHMPEDMTSREHGKLVTYSHSHLYPTEIRIYDENEVQNA